MTQLKVVQTHKNRQISTGDIVLVVPFQAVEHWRRLVGIHTVCQEEKSEMKLLDVLVDEN